MHVVGVEGATSGGGSAASVPLMAAGNAKESGKVIPHVGPGKQRAQCPWGESSVQAGWAGSRAPHQQQGTHHQKVLSPKDEGHELALMQLEAVQIDVLKGQA